MRSATGQIPAVNPVSTTPYPKRWWALAVLMLPVLLVSVDNTVLSFALPVISAQLNPTGAQLLWITDIYPLILAGLLVPAGSLGDRLGRRRLLLVGGTGFTVISAAAAFAPTADWLIAARAAMGLFGAMLMPATLSIIRNVFEDAVERRTAIAIWAAGFSGGAALGPIVGGVLLEHFSWGSIFLMAVPMLLPLLIAGPLVLPESKDPNPGAIDPLSIALVMLTMAPLVYSIKNFATAGFDLQTALTLVVAVIAGVLFTRRQLARNNPMLDVRLFTNPRFSGAVAANLLADFALVGFLYFVS
ncbi:MFS transporter, partial [Comamonas sp.]|uniref:MFS transporter n=1 Tax=Comamonas sp. TaxID=34028 RepID=UPI0028A5B2E2